MNCESDHGFRVSRLACSLGRYRCGIVRRGSESSGFCAVSSGGGYTAWRKQDTEDIVLSIDKLFENLDIVVRPFAFCCAEAGESLDLGPRDEATIHYVLGGRGVLTFDARDRVAAEPGTMVVVPAGTVHRLEGTGLPADLSERVRQCRPMDAELVEAGRNIGELEGGVAVTCGSVDARYRGLDGIFDYLPEPIVLHTREGDPIRDSIDSIIDEMARPRVGSRSMLKVLFQQCFIQLLRAHGESSECRLPWLLALEKPRLSAAIEKVIDQPGQRYSLEILADMCAMSRSTFAAQFKESFGRSPMDFVTEVRLRAGARMLANSDQPVKAIAGQVGYESRSHFSHAFQEFFGMGPSEYREAHTAGS